MIPHVFFGTVLVVTAASGVVGGWIVSWRKNASLRTLADESESKNARVDDAAPHPFRTAAMMPAASAAPDRRVRRRNVRSRTYDLMIGRTFAR
jgi:hypothetical protein